MENSAPLKNLTVIELANVLAGPSVGMFLAELGARVIKVENLKAGGDVTRTWKAPSEEENTDISAYFCAANWGKESIAIDLKAEEGREVVYDLIRSADIVLSSYKPGDAEKLHMDYAALSKLNPSLIYAEITAYGQGIPRTGFDAILQAESGFTYLNGTPESGPIKMPVALIDLLAGHQMKEAILLALLQKMQTGKGTRIEVNLLQSGIANLANQATNWLVAGKIPQPIGSDHPNIVPYGTIFHSADEKPLVIAVGNERQFVGLCKVLQVPELSQDARFSTNMERVKHKAILLPLLSERFALYSQHSLLEQLHSQQVPVGAVHTMQEVFEQPGGKAMILSDKNSPARGVSSIAFGLSHPNLLPPPHFNADAEEILSNFLHYSTDKIEALVNKKVIAHNGG